MQKLKCIPPILSVLVCVLVLLLLAPGARTLAQIPPSVTPLPTATQPGTGPSPTPEPPTDTPIPPTSTSVPPTNTTVPPTNTSAPPTNTSIPPTAKPKPTQTVAPPTKSPSEPAPTSRPDPNCRSVVKGTVTDAGGQRLTGATVTIEGEGWSRAMLTSDAGRFGFGSLCGGEAALQAALPGGKVGAITVVSLNGKDEFEVNLGIGTAGASVAATITVPTGTAAPAKTPVVSTQTTPATEPGMPTTGFPGWLLVGAALLGAAVLLLTAGMRRLFLAAERTRKQE